MPVSLVPSLSQIEAWDTSHLSSAAAFWTRTATTWENCFATVHQQMSRPGGTAWEGTAADAALNRATGDVIEVRRVAEQLRSAGAAARAGVDDLYAAKQQALNVIEQARVAGFDVSENLTVTTRRAGGTAFDRAIGQAHAKAYASDIRTKAAALAALDQQVATKITTAAAGIGKVTFSEAPIYNGKLPNGQERRGGVQAVGHDTFKQSPIPDPGTPDDPASSTGRTAANLRAATGHLPQGTRPAIKLIQSEAELRRLWNWVSENAPERTGSTHPGTQRVLADGTIVSIREVADSTRKPAIDIRYPDGSTQKYHINEAKGGTPNYPTPAPQSAPRPPGVPHAEPPRPAPEPPPGRVPIPPVFPGRPDLVELPGAGQIDPPPLDSDGIDTPSEGGP